MTAACSQEEKPWDGWWLSVFWPWALLRVLLNLSGAGSRGFVALTPRDMK